MKALAKRLELPLRHVERKVVSSFELVERVTKLVKLRSKGKRRRIR